MNVSGMNYFASEKRREFLQGVKAARDERAYEKKRENSVIVLQSAVRGWLARKEYRKIILNEFDSVFNEEYAFNEEQQLKPAVQVYRLTKNFFSVWRKDLDRNRFCNLCRYITRSLEEENPSYSYVGVFLVKEYSILWINQLKEVLNKCNSYLNSIFAHVRLNVVDLQNTVIVLLHTMVSLTSISTWRLFHVSHSLSENLRILRPGLNQLCHNIIGFLLKQNFYVTLKEILRKTFMPSFGASKLTLTNTSLMAVMILASRPLLYSNFANHVLTMYIENILTVPAIVHHTYRICPQFFKSFEDKQLLDHIVIFLNGSQSSTNVFMVYPSFVTNFKESNGLLCFTANFIELGKVHLDHLSETKRELEFINALSFLLSKCKYAVRTTQSSNLTQWHPILGWFSQDGYDLNVHESLPLIKRQLSLLWMQPYITLLLENPVQLYLSGIDVTELQSSINASTSRNSFGRKALNLLADATNINVRWKIGDSCQKLNKSFFNEIQHKLTAACTLYRVMMNTFIQLRLDILTGLCYQSNLLNLFWRYCSTQNGGLKFFYRFVASPVKSNDFFDDLNCQILMLFCECLIHYVTILDDVEMYEQQSVFSLTDFVQLSAFLNNFLYKGIINDVFREEGSNEVMNELFITLHRLLTVLHLRDCRRSYSLSASHWIIKDIKPSSFFQELEKNNKKILFLKEKMPHVISYQERYHLFKKTILSEKSNLREQWLQQNDGISSYALASNFPLPVRLIKIRRNHIVEDAFHYLYRLSSAELKQPFRIKFLNKEGLEEAGIDQAGIFKEFLVDLIQKLFDPSLNLFRKTSNGHLYPSSMTEMCEVNHLDLVEFCGKMLAKAIFEGVVLDIRLASFFFSQIVGQTQSTFYSYLDDLPSLDEELFRSLMYVKRYEGDVEDLCLTFSTTEECFGTVVTRELVPGGKAISVTKYNKIIYIHLMAHFRMHTQIKRQTAAFMKGFYSLLSKDSVSMFSVPELQLLISGEDEPLNFEQLRQNTQYYGGFHDSHKVIVWLWDILKNDFNEKERGLFLKFVTSNSKPPVLGFANLNPPFSIRCVEVSEDEDHGDSVGSVIRGFFTIRRKGPEHRLPTSSTCFNLLKLPNYSQKTILKDKLRYAITANSGFELS